MQISLERTNSWEDLYLVLIFRAHEEREEEASLLPDEQINQPK